MGKGIENYGSIGRKTRKGDRQLGKTGNRCTTYAWAAWWCSDVLEIFHVRSTLRVSSDPINQRVFNQMASDLENPCPILQSHIKSRVKSVLRGCSRINARS